MITGTSLFFREESSHNDTLLHAEDVKVLQGFPKYHSTYEELCVKRVFLVCCAINLGGRIE